MHAFAFHVPQFLHLYDGNITIFNQQGLEKLNDVTTKHFQRGTNHHDTSALKQILQKHTRLQTLERFGYQRKKAIQKCIVSHSWPQQTYLSREATTSKYLMII